MQFEKNQNRFKICALCDNRIHKNHVVCEDHIKDMEKYKHEQWFQELCKMQQRQYEIDIEEYRFINHGSYIPTLQKSTKLRNKLTQTDKNNIIRLSNNKYGWRKIAKTLNLNPNTVRNFIYRNKYYGTQFVKIDRQ